MGRYPTGSTRAALKSEQGVAFKFKGGTLGEVLIGTSGWSYDHWDDLFYPEEVPNSKRFPYYSTRFPTVEVNSSFYRLPTKSMVQGWHEQAPPRFRFAVKGSRLITHYRRLRGVQDEIEEFMQRVGLLKSFLSVVLWQLPPTLHPDLDLLDAFLKKLPRTGVRHAVEFRDPEWLTEETFDILRQHKAAHVNVSSSGMPMNLTVTAGFVYVRFHGLKGFDYDYPERQLRPWADFLRAQAEEGRDAYVYFNNDGRARAPANARTLVGMMGDVAYRWDYDGAEALAR